MVKFLLYDKGGVVGYQYVVSGGVCEYDDDDDDDDND